MTEEPIIQEIRDWFDELFLWTQNEISEKSKQLFTALWIEWFAEICARSKKHGFNASQRVLQDLVKLSFVVYSNLEKLPIQRKVILPEKNGSYKFIVTSLPHTMLRVSSVADFAQQDTNVLFLVSTGDDMHAKIAESIWLKWISWEINILWWARIDIDHDQKTLNIRDDSGSYWSCSNQFVEWMLQEYKEKWYTITINMKNQREFFDEKEELSQEVLLEKKLELLHTCLMPEDVPEQLTEELSIYQDAFTEFQKIAKASTDPFEDKYIEALRTFRDILLADI